MAFSAISKWFWAAGIAVTCANAAIFRVRARKRIQEAPELEDGYRKIIKGFVIWGNIPWLVMGIGCTVGGVPTLFHYFRPRDGNPFVLAFFASVFLVWFLGTFWLFFRNGAEMLVRHPGLFNHDFRSPTMVKLLWCLCLAGGVLAVVMMFTHDMPIPE